MTSVAINLRKRPVADVVMAPLSVVRRIVESGDREQLHKFFSAVIEAKIEIHDAHWLDLITAYGGKDAIKWIGLRARVDALDREREGIFRITDAQAQLIKGRLKDDEFMSSLGKIHPCFANFVLEFAKAAGYHLVDEVALWDTPAAGDDPGQE